MRKRLKVLLRPLQRVPILGRLLRVTAATWRGPSESVRLAQVEEAALGLTVRLDQQELGRQRPDAPATAGLERLLDVVTQVSARQAEIDADRDHLAKSVPVALRRLTRAQRELEGRVGELASHRAEDRAAAFVTEAHAVETELLSTAVADVRRQADETAGHVAYLLERVEFIRSELLFEIRYGQVKPSDDAAPIAPVVKVDLENLARPLRVNLGCGHRPIAGYVNLDGRDLPGVDVVADVHNLPFADGTIDEFFSSHFLEHFPQEEVVRILLPSLRQKLAAGGRLRAVVPDIEAMMRGYIAGDVAYDDLREVTYGAQDYSGDFHYNMYTPESLTTILERAGFGSVTVPARGRVNGRSLEFEIEAVRG